MNLMRRNKHRQSGQIVLVALLIGLVVLTMGLGVASRSITDIKLSRQEEESSRAFNVAEAGIEKFLKETDLAGLVDRYTEIVKVGETDIARVVDVEAQEALSVTLQPNETLTVDLSEIGFVGSLVINWIDTATEDPGCNGEGADNSSASIEVMVYREEEGNYSVKREGYNSCSDLNNDNGFDTTADVGGGGFKSAVTIADLDNNDKLVRVRVLYTKATVSVQGSVPLGAQTYRITSRASAPVGETRQVVAERTNPGLPAIFDYVLFSGSGLTK